MAKFVQLSCVDSTPLTLATQRNNAPPSNIAPLVVWINFDKVVGFTRDIPAGVTRLLFEVGYDRNHYLSLSVNETPAQIVAAPFISV